MLSVLPPEERGLDIEITESLLMDNMSEAIEKLQAVRELGVEISIDDFGTGHSSLAYIPPVSFPAFQIAGMLVSVFSPARGWAGSGKPQGRGFREPTEVQLAFPGGLEPDLFRVFRPGRPTPLGGSCRRSPPPDRGRGAWPRPDSEGVPPQERREEGVLFFLPLPKAGGRRRFMQLFTLGLNHQTAPLAIRERVAFHAERLQFALAELMQREPVREAAILSTCNRTELYCAAGEPQAALEWLAGYHRVQPQALKPYVYTLPQGDAVRHAFRVASGLDSMVLGEPQILGQMKEAVRSAESAGTLGTTLHKLFQRSFAVAKEVRTNTGIGANVVSMAAAAVKLAARIFPSIGEQNVLFIGAGEMIELCATHFAAQAPARITVANRTLERAQALAHRFNARAIELRELAAQLHEYDVVISCTASSLPILGKGLAERALKARRHRPDVHGRPGRAARHRARGRRAGRRVPVHGGRSLRHRFGEPRCAPFGGGAGRGHHRDPGRPVHALDGGARERCR